MSAATCARPACDATFRTELDHAGYPRTGGPPRLYCSVACRELNELERKRAGRAAATAIRLHDRHVADLRALELVEPPIPGMPTHPLLEEASHG